MPVALTQILSTREELQQAVAAASGAQSAAAEATVARKRAETNAWQVQHFQPKTQHETAIAISRLSTRTSITTHGA